MALPIIPDCFRITVNYQPNGGVTPRNVFHVGTTLGDVDEVADVIDQAAGAKLLMNGMDPAFRPLTFDVLPLDGETATQTYDFQEGAWTTSSAGGQFSPASAGIVKLKTAKRGLSGRGRVYIGPMQEASIDSGMLVGDTPDDLAEAWQGFRDDMRDDPRNVDLVIASYTLAEMNVVTSINVETVLGTQRRRQQQLR